MVVITATINKGTLNELPKQLAHALMVAAQEYQPQHQLCDEAAIEIATGMVELADSHLVELAGSHLVDPSDHFTLEIHVDMDVIAGMAQQLKNIRVKELQAEQKHMEFLDRII
jgi:hypothetical protein